MKKLLLPFLLLFCLASAVFALNWDTITQSRADDRYLNVNGESDYTSCGGLETDANGNLVCGTGASGSWNLANFTAAFNNVEAALWKLGNFTSAINNYLPNFWNKENASAFRESQAYYKEENLSTDIPSQFPNIDTNLNDDWNWENNGSAKLDNNTVIRTNNETWVNTLIDNRVTQSFVQALSFVIDTTIQSWINDNRTEIEQNLENNVTQLWANTTTLAQENNDTVTTELNTKLENNTNVQFVNATVDSLPLGWTNLTNYPASCSDGFYITALGDVVTCTSANSSLLQLSQFDNDKLKDISSQGELLSMNFNNGSIDKNGNPLDSSGNNYHGTVSNAIYSSLDGFNDGGAYQFDGNDDYISLGSDIKFGNDSTICTWFKDNSSTCGSGETIVRGDGIIFRIDHLTGCNLRYYIDGGSSLFNIPWNKDQEWHHACIMTHLTPTTQTNITAVVDGEQVLSTVVSAYTRFNDGEKYISYTGNQAFNGTLDDIRIYNRNLSIEEMQSIYYQRAEVKNSFVSQKDIKIQSDGSGIMNTSLNVSQIVSDGEYMQRPFSARICNTNGGYSTKNCDYVCNGKEDCINEYRNANTLVGTTLGGGVIFVDGGDFMVNVSSSSLAIQMTNDTHWVYSPKAHINNSGSVGMYRQSNEATAVLNWQLIGINLVGPAIYSRGNVNNSKVLYGTFDTNNRSAIYIFWDGFADYSQNEMAYNHFTGNTSGWDVLGGGGCWHCSYHHNIWENIDGQALAVANVYYSDIYSNHMIHTGNCIGLEGPEVWGTNIFDNYCYDTGYIKIALGSGIDYSKGNNVYDNQVLYSRSGCFQARAGEFDSIHDNLCYASEDSAYEISCDNCRVYDNDAIDTNLKNSSVTMTNGTVLRNGGFTFFNATNMMWPNNTYVSGNRVIRTSENNISGHPLGLNYIPNTGGYVVTNNNTKGLIFEGDNLCLGIQDSCFVDGGNGTVYPDKDRFTQYYDERTDRWQRENITDYLGETNASRILVTNSTWVGDVIQNSTIQRQDSAWNYANNQSSREFSYYRNENVSAEGFIKNSTFAKVSDQGKLFQSNFNNASISDDLILDNSQNNNHGRLNGVTYNDTGGYDGTGAFIFDGNDDYIIIPGAVGGADNESTFIIDMKWENLDCTNSDYLFRALPGIHFRIDSLTSCNLRFYLDGSTSRFVSWEKDNLWHRVGVTVKNISSTQSNVTFWVDGSPNSGNANSFISFNSGQDIYVSLTGTNAFNGTLDNPVIYRRFLTAEEMKADYQNFILRKYPENSFVLQKDLVFNDSKVLNNLSLNENLGLGTKKPTNRLQVTGNTNISGSLNATHIESTGDVVAQNVKADSLNVSYTNINDTVVINESGITFINSLSQDLSNVGFFFKNNNILEFLISGNRFFQNASGKYCNVGGEIRKIADNPSTQFDVGRSLSSLDDFCMDYEYDIVCDSTETTDCGFVFNATNGKKAHFSDGVFPITRDIFLNDFTSWNANGNTTINFTSVCTNAATRYPIVARDGLSMHGMRTLDKNINQDDSEYCFIKINASRTIPTEISGNYFEDTGIRFGPDNNENNQLQYGNRFSMHNNVCKDVIECAFIAYQVSFDFSFNTVLNSSDSSVSINHCGIGNIISYNFINNSHDTGAPIEIFNDASCGPTSDNKIIGNTVTGFTGYEGLISEVGSANNDSGRNLIQGNTVFQDATNSNERGIAIRWSGTQVKDNIIYDTGGAAILIDADNQEMHNNIVSGNSMSNANRVSDEGIVRVYALNYNITNLQVNDNLGFDSPSTSNGLQFNIEAAKLVSNSSFVNNLWDGSSYCIRVNKGAGGDDYNNLFSLNRCQHAVTHNIDTDNLHDMGAYASLATCATDNVFNGHTVVNGSGTSFGMAICTGGTFIGLT